jgi:hypothetical protein
MFEAIESTRAGVNFFKQMPCLRDKVAANDDASSLAMGKHRRNDRARESRATMFFCAMHKAGTLHPADTGFFFLADVMLS